MEAEEAWDLFRESAAKDLRKSASVSGQLDTLAAQIQNIQTGVDRITKLIPQFMGDESAIDTANAEAQAPGNPLDSLLGGADATGAPEDSLEDEPTPEEGAEAPEEESEEELPTEEDEEVDKADDSAPENVLGSPDDESESIADVIGSAEMPENGGEEEVVEETVSDDAPDIPSDEEDETESEESGEDVPEEVPEDIPEEEMTVEEDIAPATKDGGINDIYANIFALLIQAATMAKDSDNGDAMAGIMKSAGDIQRAYGEMCPYLDSVMGTDHFTKSYKEVSGMKDMEKCGSNTEGGLEKSVTGAEAPDDMIEKSDDAPAEITDASGEAMEKSATEMHDVEDEKGEEETKQDGPKLGPNDMSKSQTGLRSIRDMLSKGRSNARLEDELEKTPEMTKSETSTKMPEVPETGEDKSVAGTASENAPAVPETGEDMSVTGSASTGVKPTIDPGSEKSELQKGDETGCIDQSAETDGALSKSQMAGKPIMSMKDMIMKSQTSSRPSAISTANGDVTTPTFGTPMLKSSGEKVRMGPGVDPHEVTRADWERYNLFKARGKF